VHKCFIGTSQHALHREQVRKTALKVRLKAKRLALQDKAKKKDEDSAPCLRSVCWRNDSLSGMQSYIPVTKSADVEYLRGADKNLPSSYQKAGITCRIPDWDAINQPVLSEAVTRSLDPPRSRHSDGDYASFCIKLMNSLSGPARVWATCEFFYSDLDRAW